MTRSTSPARSAKPAVRDVLSRTIRQLSGNQSGLFDFIEDPQVLQPYLAGDLEHDRQFVILVNSLTLDDQVGSAEASAAFDQVAATAACG